MCQAEDDLFEAEETLEKQGRLIASFLERMDELADEGVLPAKLEDIRLEMVWELGRRSTYCGLISSDYAWTEYAAA